MSHRLACSCLLLLLVASLGCDDALPRIVQVVEQGGKRVDQAWLEAKRLAAASPERGEAGRGAKGISRGPDQAKRLYYQFVDARGRVTFVERLADVPAQWRDTVGFVEMDSPPPLSPAMAEQTRERRYAESPQTRRVAVVSAARPILYSADWCGWCRKARQYLDGMGTHYDLRDIDLPENLDELLAKTGQRGIPVLDVGGRLVTGFSPERYEQLIRQGG